MAASELASSPLLHPTSPSAGRDLGMETLGPSSPSIFPVPNNSHALFRWQSQTCSKPVQGLMSCCSWCPTSSSAKSVTSSRAT